MAQTAQNESFAPAEAVPAPAPAPAQAPAPAPASAAAPAPAPAPVPQEPRLQLKEGVTSVPPRLEELADKQIKNSSLTQDEKKELDEIVRSTFKGGDYGVNNGDEFLRSLSEKDSRQALAAMPGGFDVDAKLQAKAGGTVQQALPEDEDEDEDEFDAFEGGGSPAPKQERKQLSEEEKKELAKLVKDIKGSVHHITEADFFDNSLRNKQRENLQKSFDELNRATSTLPSDPNVIKAAIDLKAKLGDRFDFSKPMAIREAEKKVVDAQQQNDPQKLAEAQSNYKNVCEAEQRKYYQEFRQAAREINANGGNKLSEDYVDKCAESFSQAKVLGQHPRLLEAEKQSSNLDYSKASDKIDADRKYNNALVTFHNINPPHVAEGETLFYSGNVYALGKDKDNNIHASCPESDQHEILDTAKKLDDLGGGTLYLCRPSMADKLFGGRLNKESAAVGVALNSSHNFRIEGITEPEMKAVMAARNQMQTQLQDQKGKDCAEVVSKADLFVKVLTEQPGNEKGVIRALVAASPNQNEAAQSVAKLRGEMEEKHPDKLKDFDAAMSQVLSKDEINKVTKAHDEMNRNLTHDCHKVTAAVAPAASMEEKVEYKEKAEERQQEERVVRHAPSPMPGT